MSSKNCRAFRLRLGVPEVVLGIVLNFEQGGIVAEFDILMSSPTMVIASVIARQ
jgi:hypothetical protein